MKQSIRLTENDLHRIVKNVINESLNTVQLQLIDGYFYPTDSISNSILKNEYGLGRIPERRIDDILPKLTASGYKTAISDYYPHSYSGLDKMPFRGEKVGGNPRPQKDPCVKCGFKGLCDSDGCGKKGFKLFTNKPKQY